MVERKKHRKDEITAMYFDKLPQRAKEVYFQCLFECGLQPNNHISSFHAIYGFNFEQCNSPIEVIFKLAFDMISFTEIPEEIYLLPQYEIAVDGRKYFADFVFLTDEELYEFTRFEHKYRLVIECDGHDFHEKTKQQVAKRNKRDMDLKIAGYDVIHFSGSQIFDDPISCAKDALSLIKSNVGMIYCDEE